ncbi:MAG: hypothetical protein ABFS09_00130 [Thermodesulfobacteriota bacterium]
MTDFAWKNRGLLPVLLCVLMGVTGCGTKVVSFKTTYATGECQEMWMALEKIIHNNKVADNTAVRVQGYPYLRSSRYLQALAERVESREEEFFVLEEMRLLDLEKRALELSRIPEAALENSLGKWPGLNHPSLPQKIASCSQNFLSDDRQSEEFFGHVKNGIDLDRDYSLWLRSVGLYPITSLVVEYVAENAREEMVAQLSTPMSGEELLTFRPAPTATTSHRNLKEIVRNSRKNSLLSLNLHDVDLQSLAQEFAPLLTIVKGADQDRFGKIINNNGRFAVDGSEPVVYYYFSQTFVQGIPAPQINYVVWFSERTDPAPWFERGRIDGLTFRVTLNWAGQPVFVDVIQNCGCYHFVMTNNEYVAGQQDPVAGFKPFVNGEFSQFSGNKRLQLKINSGRHQLGHVSAALPGKSQPSYRLLPYTNLEYFGEEGQVTSFFDQQGLVAGTERFERFFLFPMGIPKVGAMRQRGRQPITLVGRAYFDDPHLFDNVFSYRSPLPALKVLLPPKTGKQDKITGGGDKD